MKEEVWNALVKAFERKPYKRYKGWTFYYEYPGIFVYYHKKGYRLYFTPDHSNKNEVDIQVNFEDEVLESGSAPFYSHKASDLYAMVTQWLDFVEDNIRQKDVLDWRPDMVPWRKREDR